MNTRKKVSERTTPAMDTSGEGEEKPTLPMAVGVGLGMGVGMSVSGVGVGVSPLPGTPDLLAATTGTTATAVMTPTSTPPVLDGSGVGTTRVTPRLGGLGTKRMGEALEKGGCGHGGAGGTGGNKRRPTNATTTITQAASAPETPLPRPAAAISRLTEYATTADLPSQQLRRESPSQSTQSESCSQEECHVFSIRPLMGTPFTITLTKDSSLFDLKDAIFAKAGITPDMQLLAVVNQHHHPQETPPAVNFDNEEQFLDDLALPRPCTLYLSVRATTGQQVLNDMYVGEDELFVYDILPVIGGATGGSGNSNTKSGTAIIDSASSEDTSAIDTETELGGVDFHVTVPISSLPLPALQSYLLSPNAEAGADANDNGDDYYDKDGFENDRQFPLHVASGLESLRITTQDGDAARDEYESPSFVPPRPTTPFPAFRELQTPSEKQQAEPKETKAPAPNAGPARCSQCGVRCRLASQFECRCGRIFCPQHRYYDTHDCTFDHKSHDRARLASANPRVYKPTLDQL